MAIYNGTQKVSLSGIAKVYVGTQLVYQKTAPVGPVTVTTSVGNLGAHYQWTNNEYVGGASVQDYWYLDYNASTPQIEVNGSNTSGGTYYGTPKYNTSSGGQLRLYGSNDGTTIWTPNGQNYMLIWQGGANKKFTDITITFTASNTSTCLWVATGDSYTDIDTRYMLSSGNKWTLPQETKGLCLYAGDSTGNAINGNIRITEISVTYDEPVQPSTIIFNKTLTEMGAEQSWTSATYVTYTTSDGIISMTPYPASGTCPKYYSVSGGETWRFYKSNSNTFTISAATGYIIKKIKFTFASGYANFMYNYTTVASDTDITINDTSAYFTMDPSGTTQCRITAIYIEYELLS